MKHGLFLMLMLLVGIGGLCGLIRSSQGVDRMKLLLTLLATLFCSLAYAQQPQQPPHQLTPEENQKFQEQVDAISRATDALNNLEDITNKIVRNIVTQCVATGVDRTKCECLANNIPMSIAEDNEIWGKSSNRSNWVAYVSLVTLPMPESEILAKLKTPDAKKVVRMAFKARYTCN
jgi:hypothetical protein